MNPLWIVPCTFLGALIAALTFIARDRLIFGLDPRVPALIVVFLAMMVMSGCAPYARIGVGTTLNRDPYVPDHDYGSDPTFHGTIGVEHSFDTRVPFKVYGEVNHWSHLLDGGPFNSNPEVYKDEIVLGFQVGGSK